MTILRQSWDAAGIPLPMLDHLNAVFYFESRVLQKAALKNNHHFEEYEIKFPCREDIFARLKDIGAVYQGGALERNFIYDDAGLSLHAVNARLRVRCFEDIHHSNTTALVTVKKPKPRDTEFGAKEFEAEILLEGGEAAGIRDLFEKSGLQLVSSYERVRHYVKRDGLQVKFDVDFFPDIGRYVEIEGGEADVMKAAALLGIDLATTTVTHYDTLHAEWCRSRGEKPHDHIVFSSSMDMIIAEERRLSF